MTQPTDNLQMTDAYPDKLYRRLKPTFGIMQVLLICTAIFYTVQAVLALVGCTKTRSDELTGREYCGTFYIEATPEFYFGSEKVYEEWQTEARTLYGSLGYKASAFAVNAMIAGSVFLLAMFFRRAGKRQLFCGRSSKFAILSGLLICASKVLQAMSEYEVFAKQKPYYAGLMKKSAYYFRTYSVLALPALMIMTGLILKKHERMLHGENKGSAVLKIYAVLFTGGSLGWIMYRLMIRIYELINALAEWEYDAKLPFNNTLIPLPRSYAKNIDTYTDIIMFRFLKDMPIFIASGVAAVLLMLVMFSAARGKINSENNRTQLLLSVICLATASLLYGIMGIHEVNMLTEGFGGAFANARYAVGLRSLCEPAIYAAAVCAVYMFIVLVPDCDTASGDEKEAASAETT